MRKRVNSCLVILMAAFSVFTFSGCSGGNNALHVSTAVASKQELEMPLELSGVLLPAQTVDISSKISGQVIKLGFTVGSIVKQGDTLITLDSEAINGQLIQAQASLRSAEGAAQTARNQVDMAKISLEAAQRAYERTKLLYDSGAIPTSQLEEVEDKLNITKKQYEMARSPAQEQARAAVDVARANINNFKIQLANTTIKSPINGILASQTIDAGEVLSPNVTVISIVDTSSLRLKSSVSQENLALLKVGQKVYITVDGYPDSQLNGTVSSVGPVAVNTGEVFPVEITIPNNNGLMAGLSAHASATVKSKGIIVPSSAITQTNAESYVFVIKNNTASKRFVKVGPKNDHNIQILQGLSEGERVAVTNVRALADKMPVDVQD